MDWTEKVSLERAKLKKEHAELFQKIVEILFRHDPACINFETNDDEYEYEEIAKEIWETWLAHQSRTE